MEEDPAAEQPQDGASPGDGSPDADCLRALGRRVRAGDRRQGGRHHERGAESDQTAQKDELVGGGHRHRRRGCAPKTIRPPMSALRRP